MAVPAYRILLTPLVVQCGFSSGTAASLVNGATRADDTHPRFDNSFSMMCYLMAIIAQDMNHFPISAPYPQGGTCCEFIALITPRN